MSQNWKQNNSDLYQMMVQFGKEQTEKGNYTKEQYEFICEYPERLQQYFSYLFCNNENFRKDVLEIVKKNSPQ
jgi:hypothetical protein